MQLKVNIDTDLRIALTAGIRKNLAENPKNFDPREYLGPARELVKAVVKRKIKLLGCNDKAGLFL